MTDREMLLHTARGYRRSMQVLGESDTMFARLVEIAEAALEYGASEHTRDANCSAGDCDSCSAREALQKLEALVGEP